MCWDWCCGPEGWRRKETSHDAVMERVDAEGPVIGFSILGVSQFSKAMRRFARNSFKC